MAEVLFYHLERAPLERVLPDLLTRSLQRGWRALVTVGSDERLEALNAHLWTYNEASFLPHGTAADGNAADQPVFLTTGDENPNGARIRFLADGAHTETFDGYERIVFLFDAGDEEAVSRARRAFRAARTGGHDVTYWRQDESGRWAKQG